MRERICKKCGAKAKIEPPKRHCDDCVQRLFYPPDLLPSLLPLTVVCGPSGSGKSTWVESRRVLGDVVIDIDNIKQTQTGQPLYSSFEFSEPAFLRRNEILRSLSEGSYAPNARAYLITQSPLIQERQHWRNTLQAVEVIVFEVPAALCLDRILRDKRRAHQVAQWIPIIGKWWTNYQRDSRDTILQGVGDAAR